MVKKKKASREANEQRGRQAERKMRIEENEEEEEQAERKMRRVEGEGDDSKQKGKYEKRIVKEKRTSNKEDRERRYAVFLNSVYLLLNTHVVLCVYLLKPAIFCRIIY